jgi:outer membrane protein TolC
MIVNRFISGFLIGAGFLGCSAAKYQRAADREVYGVISQREQQLFGRSSLFNIDTQYAGRSPETIPPGEIIHDRLTDRARRLTVTDALGMAIANNRQYQLQREQIYLSALGLTGTRHQFAFRVSDASVDLGVNRGTDGGLDGDADLGLTLTRMFKTGGRLSATLANDLVLYFDGKPKVPALTLSLTQPLLRGAGAGMAAEVLTQAERDVAYEIRSFSHFQKTFAVTVVTDYLRLLQSQDSVRNSYTNYRNLVAVRARAVAMAQAQQLPQYQVDQARQKEFAARVSYLSAVEGYRSRLDSFKILLGLPLGERVALDPGALRALEKVGLRPLPIDERAGYVAAIAGRLDVLNAIDQYEDSKRKVRVAANGLLPGLALVADTSLANQFYSSFAPGKFKQSAGIKLDLPLDRLVERNAFRTARISFEKELRSLVTTLDTLREDIRQKSRSLERSRQDYLIQQNALVLAKQRVDIMPIQVELDPSTDIRDVLEAQADLVRAQNAVTEAMVDYHVTRLNLLKDLGTLNVESPQFWLKGQSVPGFRPTAEDGAELPEVVPPEQVFGN